MKEMFKLDHNLEHGIELVAYMYGELDPASRTAFETHLAACDKCAFELGSFADARLGVIEWRREDFDPLATPMILVPDTQPVAAFADRPVAVSSLQGLWESLLSWPLFARVGTGLAAAALVAGAVYFTTVSLQPADVADQKPAVINNSPATTAKEPVKEVVRYEPTPEPKRPAPLKSEKVIDRHPTPRIQLASSRTTVRSASSAGVRTRVQTASTKLPRLNNVEEEEDKSLRLTDLFAEIGTSEE